MHFIGAFEYKGYSLKRRKFKQKDCGVQLRSLILQLRQLFAVAQFWEFGLLCLSEAKQGACETGGKQASSVQRPKLQ